MTNTIDQWPAGATATMNVTYTQANAAGGAIKCEISPGAGNEFIVLAVRQVNSGTNTCVIYTETATGGTAILFHAQVTSGAGTQTSIGVGSVDTAGNTTGVAGRGIGYPHIISGTQALQIGQTGAGAQNDTMQVLVNLRCKGAMPTVTHANSTNPANVTVTAGAESFTVI